MQRLRYPLTISPKFLKKANVHDGTLKNTEEIIDGNVTWNDEWSNRLDRSLSSVEDTVRLERQAVNLVLEVKIKI
jgi:hypothetical protein